MDIGNGNVAVSVNDFGCGELLIADYADSVDFN